MPQKNNATFSRRERQIMDIIYQRGKATAAEVQEALPDPPGYSSIRALLRILEEKGHLQHEEDGPRYLYSPTKSRKAASRSALRRLLQTFFEGSLSNAVTAFVDDERGKLSAGELERLEQIIKNAKTKN